MGRLRILFPQLSDLLPSLYLAYNGIHGGLLLASGHVLGLVLEPSYLSPSSTSLRVTSKVVPKEDFPKRPAPNALVASSICYEYSLEGLLLSLGKYALLCLLKDE